MAISLVIGDAETNTNHEQQQGGTVGVSTDSHDFFANPPPGQYANSPASSTSQLQWTATPTLPWQTVNLLVGEWCRVYTMTPAAAACELIRMLQQFRLNAYQ